MREVLSGCNIIGHGLFGSMQSNSAPPTNYDNIEMEGIGSLTLPNSLKAPFERFELSGNSKQGRIVNISSAELEQGTLNATNGENVYSDYRVRTKDFVTLEKGLYKITCEGAIQGNVLEYEENGTWKKTLFVAHTAFPFYFTVNETCKIRLAASNGTEAEAIAIKPETVKNITVATEATQEYPQEIKSVGRKSRNLFDISKFPLEHDEEAIIIKPTDVTAKLIDGNELEENTRYTVWFESYENTQTENTDAPLIEIVYTDGTKSEIYVHRNFYIKTDASKNVSYIWFRNPWKGGCKLSRLQIEKGNSITQYEPYGMYLLDVQVSGRNLVDIDALRNENGYVTSSYETSRDINNFDIVQGKKYLLITKGKPLVSGEYSSIYFGEDDLKYGANDKNCLATGTGYICFTSGKQIRTILTAKKTCTITKMILHGKNYIKDGYEVEQLGLFEILEDNTNIDYEPYKEPQTTQIALDEPLRGIGEYKDVVTKDGILRRIKEIVLGENTGFETYWATLNKTFAFISPTIKDATVINGTPNRLLCNYSKALPDSFDRTDEEVCVLFNRRFHIRFLKERNIDTVEKLKEWLKQNPIKIQYLLQEPVLEMFENNLGNLHANDGTTVVTIDSGEVKTGIKCTYRKGK